MSNMAEVLEEHGWQGTPTACFCGWQIPQGFYPRGTTQAHAAHQVEMLQAAGFGLVNDAKAEALEEAAEVLGLRAAEFKASGG